MKASPEIVQKDLENCGNPVYSRLYMLLEHTAEQVTETYQRESIMRGLGRFILWVLYKDSAYRDILIWMLYQLLGDADRLRKEIKPYLKEPDEWYVNAWNASKRHTAEERAKGNVLGIAKADDESIFTPSEQKIKLNKY